MIPASMPWPPEADHHATATRMTLAAVLIAVVFGGAWVIGRTERAVYLGIVPGNAGGGVVHLRTEPSAALVMPRDGRERDLVVGCRYDFNYEPRFGRHRGHDRGAERRVRRATLVDCPPA